MKFYFIFECKCSMLFETCCKFYFYNGGGTIQPFRLLKRMRLGVDKGS